MENIHVDGTSKGLSSTDYYAAQDILIGDIELKQGLNVITLVLSNCYNTTTYGNYTIGCRGNIDCLKIWSKSDLTAVRGTNEVELSVMIYDFLTKTGSDALDVLLSDKRLLCGKENISFTYVVDGKALSFISESDIYSLFGNALENSIDYFKGIEDKSKRFIRLSVKPIEKNLVIHVENYYEGKALSFIDGLPKTTKGDENYHGFGLKSIKEIVSLYSDDFFIKTKNHLFIVDALIPIPEEKK